MSSCRRAVFTAILAFPGCTSLGTAAHAAPAGHWRAEVIGAEGVIDGSQPMLRLAADGEVDGMAGCNNYAGRAKFEGSAIAFGPLATTRKMCPPAVMAQETKFLSSLEQVRQWRLEGQKLQLLDPDGRPLMLLESLP